jgi:hypothetical protein
MAISSGRNDQSSLESEHPRDSVHDPHSTRKTRRLVFRPVIDDSVDFGDVELTYRNRMLDSVNKLVVHNRSLLQLAVLVPSVVLGACG